MKYMYYRNLVDVCFTEAEAKAEAEEVTHNIYFIPDLFIVNFTWLILQAPQGDLHCLPNK